MTLDEAIIHCEEIAEAQEKKARKLNDGNMSTRIKCEECANKHRQLAEWLRELKAYREGCQCDDCIHSQKAHDEYPCYMCVDSELWKFNGGKC